MLLFEKMRDRKGAAVPPTDVHATFSRLEEMENDSSPLLFTDLRQTPERTELVLIDKTEFQATAPPANNEGAGGVVYLTLRTIQ